MKLTNLLFIALLAIAIGACSGAATEQKKDDAKDATKTEKKDNAEKKDDTDKKEESNSSEDSPKQAVTDFVKAYQAKDIEGLKKRFSKATLETMEKGAKLQKKELDDQLKAFVELGDMPFKDVPEMRNEKIDGDKATIEVKADGKWEPTPLVKEDGMWKLDFQDMKK